MLNLEQVKLLENKVEKLIALVQTTLNEKASLKIQLIEKDRRIAELENLLSAFRDDQSKIEAGILNTLSHLNTFEKTVSEQENSAASSAMDAENNSVISPTVEESAVSEPVPQDKEKSETVPSDSNTLNTNENNNDKQMDIF